jgi:hypothetical protein
MKTTSQKIVFILSLLTIFCSQGFSQKEVKTTAFFMVGDYSNPEWEKLVFKVVGSDFSINYSYKKNEKGHLLEIMSLMDIEKQTALVVKIPKFNKIYYILRDKKNAKITMMSQDKSYRKTFSLGYEGPINGVGTYCASCANEPAEAFKIVNFFF